MVLCYIYIYIILTKFPRFLCFPRCRSSLGLPYIAPGRSPTNAIRPIGHSVASAAISVRPRAMPRAELRRKLTVSNSSTQTAVSLAPRLSRKSFQAASIGPQWDGVLEGDPTKTHGFWSPLFPELQKRFIKKHTLNCKKEPHMV